MQLISIFSGFEFFKRKINTIDSLFEHSEINQNVASLR